MDLKVLVGAVAAGLLLAILNNLVNPDAVAWIGSPEILEKPSDWPTLSMAAGMAAGFKVAWKSFLAHKAIILSLAALVVAAIAVLKRLQGISPSPVLRSVVRIGLAAMFLAAAWPKFSHPEDFALLVAQYQFLPAFLVNPFSLLLAAFEIVVALGLLFTPWEKEFTFLTGGMMVMFIIALAQALARGLGIACGCFDIEGAADAGETWFSLLRDVVLLPVIFWAVVAGRRRWLWQLRMR
jgi:hypothetical protein